jgi:hypothetical protein
MNVDLTQFFGLAGAPLIESFVEYLKAQWKLPGQFAPLAAVLSALIFNIFVGLYLLQTKDIRVVVEAGLLTGFVASGWHELTTPKPTNQP